MVQRERLSSVEDLEILKLLFFWKIETKTEF